MLVCSSAGQRAITLLSTKSGRSADVLVLQSEVVASMFETMEPASVESLLRSIGGQLAALFVSAMKPPLAADLLKCVDTDIAAEVLDAMESDAETSIRALLDSVDHSEPEPTYASLDDKDQGAETVEPSMGSPLNDPEVCLHDDDGLHKYRHHVVCVTK